MYPSNLAISWSVNDTSLASISGNVITGKAKGTVKVTAAYTNAATGQSTAVSIYVRVVETKGVQLTEYYIMN